MDKEETQDKEEEEGWRVGGEDGVIRHQQSRHISCYSLRVPLRGD